ncbi:MAG: hypothetical protein LBB82_08160 [Treponema sp.]|jgi:hypothetical protein|nr:hypothetical protein [Treponema sp.]
MIEALVQESNISNEERLAEIRARLEDENYLHEAVQRLAQVLSNEISGFSADRAVKR